MEIVRRDFAEKYPDIVSKYIKAVDKAVKLYKENEGEAVKTVADALHITEEEEALKQMQGSVWLTAKKNN